MMSDMTGHEDFYEDDEPVSKIITAFQRGRKVVTEPTARGINQALSIPGLHPNGSLGAWQQTTHGGQLIKA